MNPIEKLKERLDNLNPKPDTSTYVGELLKLAVIVDELIRCAEIYREISITFHDSCKSDKPLLPKIEIEGNIDNLATKLLEGKE